jgi:hypothetical protein
MELQHTVLSRASSRPALSSMSSSYTSSTRWFRGTSPSPTTASTWRSSSTLYMKLATRSPRLS